MRGKQEVVELSNKRGYLLAESVSERSSSLRRKILEVLQLQLQRSTPVSIKMLSQEIVRSDTNRYSENWDCTELKETLDSLVQNREIFSHLSGWVLELPYHPHGHIKLLVKYEQSGKTRIVLNAVQAHSGGQNVLNIIFCDNSLLLTTATTLRAGSHSDLVKEGSINLSSDPKHHQWKDITEDALDGGADTSARKTCVQAIREGDVNTIICCGHKRRFEDIQDLIELLSSDGFLFNIHVDEADKVLRPPQRKELVRGWHANPQVMSIELIRATPFKPDKSGNWSKLSWLGDDFGPTLALTKQDEMFGEGYHLLSKSKFVPFMNSGAPAKYAEAYLNTRESPAPGSTWFIPGGFRQQSHDDVEEMCLSSGKFDAVIKLNGKAKTIRWANRLPVDTIDVEGLDENTLNLLKYTTDCNGKQVSVIKTKEVKDWLSEYYAKVNGKKFRFAITGCICVSRGITISHKDCPITHAVCSPSCYTTGSICEMK